MLPKRSYTNLGLLLLLWLMEFVYFQGFKGTSLCVGHLSTQTSDQGAALVDFTVELWEVIRKFALFQSLTQEVRRYQRKANHLHPFQICKSDL